MRKLRIRGVRAFTLIELLVVIAIIAILAAILFPVLMSAKYRGYQVKCLQNLRQLSTGVFTYADDYDSTFPRARVKYGLPTWEGTIGPGVIDPAKGQIWPYVKSKGIYVCPSEKKYVHLSYSMNCRIFDHFANPKRPVKMSDVWRPSWVLLLIHEKAPVDDGDFKWINDDNSFTNAVVNEYSDIHYDGTNLVYIDGHAVWKSTKRLDIERKQCIWDPYHRLKPM